MSHDEVWVRKGEFHRVNLTVDGSKYELYECLKDFEIYQTVAAIGIDVNIAFSTPEEALKFSRLIAEKLGQHGYLSPAIGPKESLH